MNKELQDLVWSILPKEFKEEVKKRYKKACRHRDLYSARGTMETLELLFGLHNLTSDAEGEGEMLCVSRKRVQEFYAKCKEVTKNPYSYPNYSHESALSRMALLDILYGSKCLPDNVATSESNVDSLDGNVESLKPKPAEPKFKVGDKVRYRCDGKIHEVKAKTGKYHYALSGLGHDAHEEYLELYTEPEKNIAETRNLSQDRDKLFDNILKNSFSKERRLAIAVQMMQGLICAPLVPGVDPNPPAEQLAQAAFRLADALIAEAEKE